MATQVIMPQLGESVVEGTVTRWFKQEGEAVKEMEPLLEVETDKVTTEVPSTGGGTVLKILVPQGTTVQAGTVLAWIGQPGEQVGGAAGGQAPAGSNGGSRQPEKAAAQPVQAAGRERDLGFISPVVAKLAKEKNVDLRRVKGSGESGRITKKDVLAYLEGQQAQPEPSAWETPGEGDLFRPTEMVFASGAPLVQSSQPAASEKPGPLPSPAVQPEMAGDRMVPLTNLRRSIAEHMVNSKRTSPHVTTVMEANLHKVVLHREANRERFAADGVNLTYTAYFVAAAVAALKVFPLVNSSWADGGILLHGPINIGMATSLGEDGLIVPVIKNAAELSLLGIARAVNDLASRARARRLQPDEVKGGTFTITNHGTSGSLFATPIINQPQCAILGVGAIQKRVVVIDDAIAIRPMAYLSLTFDHRILDGGSADGFLAKLVETLDNWV